jgi:hypothetical protein
MNQIILQCNRDMIKVEPDSDPQGHPLSPETDGQAKGGRYSDDPLSALYPLQQKELNVSHAFVYVFSPLFSVKVI